MMGTAPGEGTGPEDRPRVVAAKRTLLWASATIVLSAFVLIPLLVRAAPSLPPAVAFMALPFLACLVFTGIHTYLGVHVIARGVIFVDLCLAQIAALGTLYAFLVGFPAGSGAAYAVSLLFTFIAAALFAIPRSERSKLPLEAVIGITYAVAMALSLLILSRAPHEAEHIRDLLTGNLLWVDRGAVLKTARIYGVVGIFLALFYPVFWRRSSGWSAGRPFLWDLLFYMTFGFVITSSVAMAGVLLVFSFLVIPAVISMLFARGMASRLAIGWSVGTAVSVASLGASYRYDIPSGACVVLFFGVALVLCAAARALLRASARARRAEA